MGSTYEFLHLTREKGIAEILMDRPPLNVLNIQMMRELNQALESIAMDQDLKLLVLKAKGKVFSAGADVADHKPEHIEEMMGVFNGMFKRLEKLPIPSLAVVNGAAMGGGCELAIGFDLVIASRNATFGQPEIKLGFFPPFAAFAFPRLIGRKRAMEMCLTGKSIDAEEAARIGLINRAVDDDKLNEEVWKVIDSICANSALILRITKKAIDDNLEGTLEHALPRLDDLVFNGLMKTEDTIEGLNSFFEKRKPVWKNR